jgi:hypothetical protein
MAVDTQHVLQDVPLWSLHLSRTYPDAFEEKRVFQEFLAKHLNLTLGDDRWSSLRNSDQIRKFVGGLVKRITDGLFKIICERASALNVCPDTTSGLRLPASTMKIAAFALIGDPTGSEATASRPNR